LRLRLPTFTRLVVTFTRLHTRLLPSGCFTYTFAVYLRLPLPRLFSVTFQLRLVGSLLHIRFNGCLWLVHAHGYVITRLVAGCHVAAHRPHVHAFVVGYAVYGLHAPHLRILRFGLRLLGHTFTFTHVHVPLRLVTVYFTVCGYGLPHGLRFTHTATFACTPPGAAHVVTLVYTLVYGSRTPVVATRWLPRCSTHYLRLLLWFRRISYGWFRYIRVHIATFVHTFIYERVCSRSVATHVFTATLFTCAPVTTAFAFCGLGYGWIHFIYTVHTRCGLARLLVPPLPLYCHILVDFFTRCSLVSRLVPVTPTVTVVRVGCRCVIGSRGCARYTHGLRVLVPVTLPRLQLLRFAAYGCYTRAVTVATRTVTGFYIYAHVLPAVSAPTCIPCPYTLHTFTHVVGLVTFTHTVAHTRLPTHG